MRHRSPVAPALLVCAALLGCPGPDFDRNVPPELDSPPSVFADVPGGFFRAPVTVGLRCNDDHGACSVYYTLDGSTPTDRSSVYRAPLTIDGHVTVRFFGRDSAGQGSSVEAQEYFVDAEAPLASADPRGGWFVYAPWATLSCSDGAGTGCAAIHYTIDGTTPTAWSGTYGAPIPVHDGMELRYVAVDRAGNVSAEGRETYRVDGTAPASFASPNPEIGPFANSMDVTLSCVDGAGIGCAAIHYTLDGTYPTTSSPSYDAPIRIARTTTIQWFAVDRAGNAETVQTLTYPVDTTPPTTTPTPAAGTYAPLWVRLSCTDVETACASTYYTTDGSEPGPGSPQYAGPFIAVDATTTLKFASVDLVGHREATREVRYVIDAAPPKAVATPPAGTYAPGVEVTLSCDDGPDGTGCGAIHYTTDSTKPTASSPTYASPLRLTASTWLRFVAFDAVGNGTEAEASYVIDGTPPRLLSSTPPDGFVGADPATALTLTFDEPIDAPDLAATVDGVTAQVAIVGAKIWVTPPAPLSADAEHIVSVTGVRDAVGNARTSATTIRFRTRGEVLPVSGDGSATVVAQGLAYDAAGNALAVYRSETSKGRKLLVARYDAAAAAWSELAELHREATSGTTLPIGAVASRGDGFLLAWSTSAGVKARRYDAAGTAGADVPLWAGGATELVVATNGTGYAVVARISGALTARVFDGTLWSLPEDLGAGWSVSLAADGASYVAAYLTGDTTSRSIATARRDDAPGWASRTAYTTTLGVGAPSIAARAGRLALAFPVVDALGAVLAAVGPYATLPAPAIVANAAKPVNVSVAASDAGVAVVFQGDVDAGTATYALTHDGSRWSAAETIATASGAPAGTRLQANGAGYLTVTAATSGGRTSLLAVARPSTSWSAAVDAAPGAASARDPLLVPLPSGYAIAFDQDDGDRHALRVRAHTGGEGTDALGSLATAAGGGDGSAREPRAAGDGAGGALAVWTQEHRGGPAVFAAGAVHGAWAADTLVALGADSPAVAAAQDGYVVVYRRGETCEARTWSAGAISAAVRIDDGTGGACASPVVASIGLRHLAAWRAGSQLRVAVFDGTRWTAPQALTTTFVYGGVTVASRPGQLAVAWSNGSGVSFRTSDGTETGWSATSTLDTGSTYDAPQVLGGAGGFAVVWLRNGVYAYASVPGSAHGGTRALGNASYANGVGIVANGNGFVALALRSSPGGIDAWAFSEPGGWQTSPTTVAGQATTQLRAAGGARGAALAFRDGTGALRGASLVDGRWTSPELIRTSVSATPALAWDGESYVLGWTEPDPLDATIDRVLSRRGL